MAQPHSTDFTGFTGLRNRKIPVLDSAGFLQRERCPKSLRMRAIRVFPGLLIKLHGLRHMCLKLLDAGVVGGMSGEKFVDFLSTRRLAHVVPQGDRLSGVESGA